VIDHELLALAAATDGVLTVQQLAREGLGMRDIHRSRSRGGWTSPVRGILVVPEPADAFRASVRAATLACPSGIVCRGTAARLHELQGLPLWQPSELPTLVLPSDLKRTQRRGLRLHWSTVVDDDLEHVDDFPRTRVVRTLADLRRLPRAALVSLLDSALHQDRCPIADLQAVPALATALALADGRSESPLETRLRLVLTAAGLAPEELQFVLRSAAGRFLARLDMAWPGRRPAVEADGRGHDQPEALYRDRDRQNDIVLEGWTMLRFTWSDVTQRPAQVVALMRAALALGG
jgi:very-short-patch-repair endonuclease